MVFKKIPQQWISGLTISTGRRSWWILWTRPTIKKRIYGHQDEPGSGICSYSPKLPLFQDEQKSRKWSCCCDLLHETNSCYVFHDHLCHLAQNTLWWLIFHVCKKKKKKHSLNELRGYLFWTITKSAQLSQIYITLLTVCSTSQRSVTKHTDLKAHPCLQHLTLRRLVPRPSM